MVGRSVVVVVGRSVVVVGRSVVVVVVVVVVINADQSTGCNVSIIRKYGIRVTFGKVGFTGNVTDIGKTLCKISSADSKSLLNILKFFSTLFLTANVKSCMLLTC